MANVLVRYLGMQEYASVLQKMQQFTLSRVADTIDEIWCLQHPAVFTQGQAGKAEHLLAPGDIPVVKSDRGGQVTYHGPGQLIVYLLCDLNRKGIGIKELTSIMQQSVLDLLKQHNINSHIIASAPGVYVASGAKICSLGLRVRKGCSYHGLSLNIAMDLEPFTRINPCGYAGMQIAQMADFIRSPNIGNVPNVATVAEQLLAQLLPKLRYTQQIIDVNATKENYPKFSS